MPNRIKLVSIRRKDGAYYDLNRFIHPWAQANGQRDVMKFFPDRAKSIVRNLRAKGYDVHICPKGAFPDGR